MGTILAPLFEKVNSATCCATNSAAYSSGMEKTSKKSKIEPVHIEEAARLKRLFDARSTTSQMKFGADNEIGSQGMVWQYLNARAPLNLDAALKFAKGLGCPVSDFSPRLAESLSGIGAVEPSNVSTAPRLLPSTDVPVVGTVQGGDQGFFVELEHPVGHGDGCITYPARDANSYALRVRGDSMRPRIKNGEFIVVEPNYPPQNGDDVVVCLLDGRRMVKELLYIRDGEITLGSINNGHGNITVSVEQVEKMHYVAAIIPRGAFYRQNEHI